MNIAHSVDYRTVVLLVDDQPMIGEALPTASDGARHPAYRAHDAGGMT